MELRQDDENGALIGRYCGNTIPSNVTAVGSLWMKFRSDSQSSGAGFLASFAMRKSQRCSHVSPKYNSNKTKN